MKFVVLVLLVSGCSEGHQGKAVTAGKVVVSGEVPITVEATENEPLAATLSPFLNNFKLGTNNVRTVVRAYVQDLSVSKRVVPEFVWPEPGPVIVTEVTAVIRGSICGEPLTGEISISYVGGAYGKSSFRTSLMSKDVAVGSTYAFNIIQINGEYFLVSGIRDYLAVKHEDNEKYTDFFGTDVTKSEIKGACS